MGLWGNTKQFPKNDIISHTKVNAHLRTVPLPPNIREGPESINGEYPSDPLHRPSIHLTCQLALAEDKVDIEFRFLSRSWG